MILSGISLHLPILVQQWRVDYACFKAWYSKLPVLGEFFEKSDAALKNSNYRYISSGMSFINSDEAATISSRDNQFGIFLMSMGQADSMGLTKWSDLTLWDILGKYGGVGGVLLAVTQALLSSRQSFTYDMSRMKRLYFQ